MTKRPTRGTQTASMWTKVNGWRIHARVPLDLAPPGAPSIVLVHGVGISSRYMVPTLKWLAPYTRVYAIDLPGFGESSKPPHTLNVPELADALAAWIEAANLDQPALLGNSLGCQIIVDLAVRYPDRLSAAVLQGPTIDPQARTWLQQSARWMINSPLEPPSQALVMARDYWACGIRRVIETFKYAMQDQIETKLPQMQVPTLVVRGSRDPIVPQRWAEEVTAHLPQGRLVVIPGGTHTINYAAPLELARVVRLFLENINNEKIHETGGTYESTRI